MAKDSQIPQLTKEVSWPTQHPRKSSPPRKPVVWTRRDVGGGLAALCVGAAILVAYWPALNQPWPVGVRDLWIVLVGNAGGILAALVSAAVAGRPIFDPFGRGKPDWLRRITLLHIVFFAGAAVFSFMGAPAGSGWLWAGGLFWVAMTVWRVRVGWRPGHA